MKKNNNITYIKYLSKINLGTEEILSLKDDLIL